MFTVKENNPCTVTVFGVIIQKGRLLMIRRAFPPFPDTRTIPGGHKRHGETLREACAREMLEETGLKVGPLRLAGYMELESPSDPRDFMSFYYRADEFSGTLLAGGPEGELSWMEASEALSHPQAHPAFRALGPFFFRDVIFEARAVVDEEGRGDYQVAEILPGPDKK